ncbi:plasmalemma vesicle associated protein b isoform X3 [Salvelinus alpinus]|uniref:plasmalemma vesicle associated protein b isoform X3 n=1 Tax=Salvelinus alpinus TaxID=8036 RepID=UPI0039FC109C
MYSSNSYSQAKFGLEAKDIHKPKGKSCGYYMRVVFFFSSLIQSLIIVSLVLFLVYGQPEKSAEERRVEELEQSLNRISENNINLRKDKSDLGAALGARKAEKTALEGEVAVLKKAANASGEQIKALILKASQCEADKKKIEMSRATHVRVPTTSFQNPFIVATANTEVKTLQSLNSQQAAMIKLIKANFTQTSQYIRIERDNAIKDRDAHNLETISLRRENNNLKEHLTLYTQKCKEDFAKSLEGIQMVTSNFLVRIDNLFPHSMTFHLTCEKQTEQMLNIRARCSNLSKEVEDKFQKYLDNVGNKVANIQAQSSSLEVQNSHLTLDLQQCRQNRSVTAAEGSRLLLEIRENHDRQVETLLKEQNRLREEKSLQGERLVLKEAEVKTLNGNVESLTSALTNCNPKPTGLMSAFKGGPSMQLADPKPTGLMSALKGGPSMQLADPKPTGLMSAVKGGPSMQLAGPKPTGLMSALKGGPSMQLAGSKPTGLMSALKGGPSMELAGPKPTGLMSALKGGPSMELAGPKPTGLMSALKGGPSMQLAGPKPTGLMSAVKGGPSIAAPVISKPHLVRRGETGVRKMPHSHSST